MSHSIFLCYASENKSLVEPVYMALVGSGYKVFFDEQSLPAGDDYHQRIYSAINKCDVFVFFISKNSLSSGKFTLSELKFAQSRWPNPNGYVLPVQIDGSSLSELPAYLSATTVLSVKGNLAAEVRSVVGKILKFQKKNKFFGKKTIFTLLVFIFLLIAFVSVFYYFYLEKNSNEDGVQVFQEEKVNEYAEFVRATATNYERLVKYPHLNQTVIRDGEKYANLLLSLDQKELGVHYQLMASGYASWGYVLSALAEDVKENPNPSLVVRMSNKANLAVDLFQSNYQELLPPSSDWEVSVVEWVKQSELDELIKYNKLTVSVLDLKYNNGQLDVVLSNLERISPSYLEIYTLKSEPIFQWLCLNIPNQEISKHC